MEQKEESCSNSFFTEEEDSWSSESTVESQSVHKKRKLNPSQMWDTAWDDCLLNLLNNGYTGDTNGAWRIIARVMKETLVTDSSIKSLTLEDCKERGKHFRQIHRRTKDNSDPNSLEKQLRRIYDKKKVPKFPRRTANPLSIISMMSRPRSHSTASRTSGAKQWKTNLLTALGYLVLFHHLKLQAVDDIVDRLNTENQAIVFLTLAPDKQMEEIAYMIGPCTRMPVELPPSSSTQLVEFSLGPSTQPLE